MKLGFIITVIPPYLYHTGEGSAEKKMVIIEIPDEQIPKIIKDATNENNDHIYLSDIVRLSDSAKTTEKEGKNGEV